MIVDGKPYRAIWFDNNSQSVNIIDQRFIPHELKVIELNNLQEIWTAIRDMYVRGAPLIGVTAAFGFALAIRENNRGFNVEKITEFLCSARPTAVNLRWACEFMSQKINNSQEKNLEKFALHLAQEIADDDVKTNTLIGKNGVELIRSISAQKTNSSPVKILTHCNAGWLATVDRGTATAPIYEAAEQGIEVEVWVDETRPRNQGASLTCWELYHNNISHTLIVDNAGGHLMQKGEVDLVIVGSDRTAINGDVCNKIGTYLKALAAFDNNIPFYAALPTSTIDFTIDDGFQIPIEERGQDEVLQMQGTNQDGKFDTINITSKGIKAANPAFDVTPAKYVSGIITEKGVVKANLESISKLEKL
jgi:methylthioribose-1-phosphate isomerase